MVTKRVLCELYVHIRENVLPTVRRSDPKLARMLEYMCGTIEGWTMS